MSIWDTSSNTCIPIATVPTFNPLAGIDCDPVSVSDPVDNPGLNNIFSNIPIKDVYALIDVEMQKPIANRDTYKLAELIDTRVSIEALMNEKEHKINEIQKYINAVMVENHEPDISEAVGEINDDLHQVQNNIVKIHEIPISDKIMQLSQQLADKRSNMEKELTTYKTEMMSERGWSEVEVDNYLDTKQQPAWADQNTRIFDAMSADMKQEMNDYMVIHGCMNLDDLTQKTQDYISHAREDDLEKQTPEIRSAILAKLNRNHNT